MKSKPIKQATDVALFIDNDKENLKGLDHCDTMHVGGTLKKLKWSSVEPFIEDVKKGTEGAQVLDFFQEHIPYITYDSQGGINQEDCEEIKKWVLNQTGSPTVLFDYGGTLTVVQGRHFFYLNNPHASMEGFLEFQMGGKERLAMLRGLFTFLQKHKVSMVVLTNNGQCGRNPLFRKHIEALFRYPVQIICSKRGLKHRALTSFFSKTRKNRNKSKSHRTVRNEQQQQ